MSRILGWVAVGLMAVSVCGCKPWVLGDWELRRIEAAEPVRAPGVPRLALHPDETFEAELITPGGLRHAWGAYQYDPETYVLTLLPENGPERVYRARNRWDGSLRVWNADGEEERWVADMTAIR